MHSHQEKKTSQRGNQRFRLRMPELMVFLYVGENDKTIHLTIKKKGYVLLCNDKKKLNKNRVAKSITDIFAIAPEPMNKIRCVHCEKQVKILIKKMNKDLKL